MGTINRLAALGIPKGESSTSKRCDCLPVQLYTQDKRQADPTNKFCPLPVFDPWGLAFVMMQIVILSPILLSFCKEMTSSHQQQPVQDSHGVYLDRSALIQTPRSTLSFLYNLLSYVKRLSRACYMPTRSKFAVLSEGVEGHKGPVTGQCLLYLKRCLHNKQGLLMRCAPCAANAALSCLTVLHTASQQQRTP